MGKEMHKPPYTYEEFLEIIEVLRGEGGCPWDREQTHMSLRPCMMEEAAEVTAGIRIYEETGNYENLREELGDVLLQVVMHAQIAKEEGIFTMEDVVSEVAEKMVRRHPHVFGSTDVKDSAQVLENWEEIKKKEKEGKAESISPLREIPIELPALTRAVKVLKKTDRLYEPAEDYQASVERLRAAADRLSQTDPQSYSSEAALAIGELLMASSNISRICKLSQEQILSDEIENLIKRHEI
ncbi:MAG: MazG family protein [Bacteroidales bacterium]|nr:MazG family protein [Lachnoclostridium sp.]MCM1384442.1 MazG family protein [Lachnoclostridium sp.]MCM1465222.1 MazG family protein [Bacteroidales bacterium]